MTKRKETLTVVVGLSGMPSSTAYSAASRGSQALSALMLKKQQRLPLDAKPNPQHLSAKFREFWLATVSNVLIRICDFGENALICERDLDLWAIPEIGAAGLPAKFAAQAKVVAATALALKFRYTKDGTKIPRPPREKVEIEEADVIAGRLYKVAQDHPKLVQGAVEYYINNIDSDSLLVVSSDQLDEISDWLSVVRATKLTIQVIGYEMANEDRPMDAVLTLIGRLGFSTKKYKKQIVWRKARNGGYVGKIGLHVVFEHPQENGNKVRSSEAFRFVMASAAIAKLWTLPPVLDPPLQTTPVPDSDGQLALF